MTESDNLIFQTLMPLKTAVEGKKNCSVFGLSFGEKSLFLCSQKRQILFVTENLAEANKLAKELECFGKKVETIFYKQSEFLLASLSFGQNVANMFSSLQALCKSSVDCLIVTPEVLMQKFPSKKQFSDLIISIKKGKTYNQKQLIQNLINVGYHRTDLTQNVGDFSVRGDIVDVFNITDDLPARIEFFDDEIESLYHYSPDDFKRLESVEKIDICPLIIFSVENKSQLFSEVEKDFSQTLKTLPANEAVLLKSAFEEFRVNFDAGNFSYVQNWLAPFMPDTNITCFLNQDAIVVFDDVKRVFDVVSLEYKKFDEQIFSLINSGNALLKHKYFYISQNKVFNIDFQLLSFQSITSSNRVFDPQVVLSFRSTAQTNYFGNYNLLLEDVKYYLEFKNTVIIFAGTKNESSYLSKFLLQNKIENKIASLNEVVPNGVYIIPKDVAYGGIFVEDRVVVIGTEELVKKSTKQVVSTQKKEEFTLPKIGDYVVHESFGIGLCVAIQKLKFTEYEKDYVVLQYAGGDKLYLPTEQIGQISAYVAGEGTPKLNKLGTKDFEKTKEKVRSSLKKLAFNLIEIYSAREHLKGFKFEIDDKLFAEFENSFPYDETPDQLEAIKDIKKDMASGKIMDRIVCGDVGYGKTEVALRGAFISVVNNKQVAFLAPTTVLSEQHYNTAKTRLANFGIRVECINRFRSKKEQTDILKRLKAGEIDVLCGTHRMLSKDVQFKDLGLLILDEEQRFGVGDKEKIKTLKTNVDVLTLSATPIPRTLHMGLVGIRDISIISTPPTGRLPVQTTVAEYSDGLLLQAINRELARDGQVLIVYNRVESIYNFSSHVRTLLNRDVPIGVAHGQMNENELEEQIMNLYSGKTKILVSTTLIENGIDLPNANTLIIIDADKLGLSQLYQLKGRVGRSKNLGYAYFTFNKDKTLSSDAFKRLNAIMEYTELGSGFKIAMKDLEIRGCGNILGPEQSGHMAKVGYDMYCKILNEAIKEIRGQKQKEYKEIKLDVALDCFVPENYIDDSENRFRIYTNLKQICSSVERADVIKQIEKTYGSVPVEIENLSYVAMLRNMAREFSVKRISIDRERCLAVFYSKQEMLEKSIATALKNCDIKVYFSQTDAIMNFMLSAYSVKKKLQIVCDVFENALKIYNAEQEKISKK